MYDPEHTWCNYPNKVDCGDRPICDENDENCDEGTTSKPDPTGTPEFVCPEHQGYFADPKNCIKYYHCFNDMVEEHITCPRDAGKFNTRLCMTNTQGERIAMYLFIIICSWNTRALCPRPCTV